MEDIRIAGYFWPDVPTIDSLPTFPRRRRSNNVNPTTPIFLSDPDAAPPTNPVVYSPVPTIKTFKGLDEPSVALANKLLAIAVIVVSGDDQSGLRRRTIK